ncbi:MAG: hypothetical protein AB2719_16520 [Candidatus Thiodiazotropha sp.]
MASRNKCLLLSGLWIIANTTLANSAYLEIKDDKFTLSNENHGKFVTLEGDIIINTSTVSEVDAELILVPHDSTDQFTFLIHTERNWLVLEPVSENSPFSGNVSFRKEPENINNVNLDMNNRHSLNSQVNNESNIAYYDVYSDYSDTYYDGYSDTYSDQPYYDQYYDGN